MPQPSYPFASARVKCKETTLLNREKLVRLANAATPSEAMKLLADFGYPGADEIEPVDFEKCITKELNEAYDFVMEVTPDERATNLFFLKFDYRNLKAILKNEAKGTGAAQKQLVNRGTLDPTMLYEAVKEKKYQDLPPEMRQALEELDRHFAVKKDVSLIGLTLDRAYAQQVMRELEGEKEEFVKAFFEASFDFDNVSALIRLKRAGAPKELFSRAMLPGGSISLSSLKKAIEMNIEDMLLYLSKGKYQRELTGAFESYKRTGGFERFNKAESDYLARLIGEYRDDMFSIAPVMAYLVQKNRESQAVRMIMVSQLNGIETKDILEMLPEL